MKLNDRGKAIEDEDFGDNVIVVPPDEQNAAIIVQPTESEAV